MNLHVTIIGISLTLLLVAAYIAVRHLRRTGTVLPGVMIIGLILLMAARRLISFGHALGGAAHTADTAAELIAAVVSGLVLFIVLHLIRLQSSGAAVTAALSAAREENREAEAALRESEERFRTLADASFEGVVISERGAITDCNTQFCRLLDFRREELIGKKITDLLPPEDRERVLENIREGREAVAEHELIGKNGIRRFVEIHGRTLPMNGKVLRMAAMRDIGERKHMEAVLSDYRLHLEELVAQRTGELREQIAVRRLADKELRCYTAQLQELSARLVQAGEDERAYIARELHDEIGQTLTGLKITIDMLSKSASPGQNETFDRLRKTAADLLKKVRSLSLNLHPALLHDLGLERALEHLATDYKNSGGLVVEIRCELPAERLPSAVELAAYRIVQEALTNVVRHAGTAAADVSVRRENGSLRILVQDDGKGFDSAAALGCRESVGLVGMRERAMSVDGALTVTAEPGVGTAICCVIPLDKQKERSCHVSDDDYVG